MEVNWPNLFSGFASAVLGALVSIAIPLVAHLYAKRVTNRTPPNAMVPPLAARISRWFGSFELSNARQFKVRYGSTFFHPNIDFSVSVDWQPRGNKLLDRSDPFVSLVLPGVKTPERHDKVTVGWTRVFSFQEETLRLTLSEFTDGCVFQLRSLGTIESAAVLAAPAAH